MKILICGAEGSGKTTLAKPLANLLGAEYINKDSHKQELKGFVDGLISAGKTVVIDKRCNGKEEIDYLDPDFIVFMDTVNDKSTCPYRYDYHVSEWFNDTHFVLVEIVKKYMERGYHNV
jgi:polynucleotide 5'-kinase involved in rRNA processing